MVWCIQYGVDDYDGSMGYFHTLESAQDIVAELEWVGYQAKIEEVELAHA